MLLMMDVCTRNMSSQEYINKITLLHQVDIPHYLMNYGIGTNVWKRLVAKRRTSNTFGLEG